MSNLSNNAHRAPVQDVVQAMALFLYAEVGAESVRTLEAVAAALVNAARVRSGGKADAGFCSTEADLREAILSARSQQASTRCMTVPEADDPVLSTCQRIARRAVRGALRDTTGGAVRFHSSAASPDWASGLVPSACVGSFLFYDAVHQEPCGAFAA